MEVNILKDPAELGIQAGKKAAAFIRNSIEEKGEASIILATGTSQFETLNQLVTENNIDWGKIVMFHLDEYIQLPEIHPASFKRYLRERFISKIGPLKDCYLINGEADPEKECNRLNNIIQKYAIDLALVGIGENGHLAFNDPPANFETEDPYIIVRLDEKCRNQQVNEGWFKSIESVPHRAISMSAKQICKSKHIICSVPDGRKARAIRNCLEGGVSNLWPASILQSHPDCIFFLERSSAKLLSGEMDAKISHY